MISNPYTALYTAAARDALADLATIAPADIPARHRALTERLDDAEAGRLQIDDDAWVITLAHHRAYTVALSIATAAYAAGGRDQAGTQSGAQP